MADITGTLNSWSSTSSSNLPANSASVGPNTLADNQRTIQAVVRAALAGDGTIASATTTDLSTVNDGDITVSGTTTITGFGTLTAGIKKVLTFSGALTLTHNATSLILPGAANITTAAGDVAIMRSLGSGNWKCISFTRAASLPTTYADIQVQLATAFTTGGTSTAYTLTPIPAITALATNQRWRVTFNAAAGATPTLAISGLTAKPLKYKDSTGAKQAITSVQVPSGWVSDVEYDGTDYVVLDVTSYSPAQIQPISASVASNALTISASSLTLAFRSTTLGSGTVSTVTGTPSNLVISSGSTLGTVSGTQSRIAVLALNNSGTIELAAVNIAGGNDLSETGLISTTAEGGAGAADSANVIYSTTARTSVAYRVIGYVESTQTTAGTWATAPSTIQGAGGNAVTAMSSLGYGSVSRPARSLGVTYYNTSGRPREVVAVIVGSSGAVASSFSYTRGSLTSGSIVASESNGSTWNSIQIPLSIIIPPGLSYSIQNSSGTCTIQQWEEL